jgi:hypothetical protein
MIGASGRLPAGGFGYRTRRTPTRDGGGDMANGTTDRGAFGIGLGGILVIVGIVVAIVWSLWIGILVALVGLIAFGGFARGRWY